MNLKTHLKLAKLATLNKNLKRCGGINYLNSTHKNVTWDEWRSEVVRLFVIEWGGVFNWSIEKLHGMYVLGRTPKQVIDRYKELGG